MYHEQTNQDTKIQEGMIRKICGFHVIDESGCRISGREYQNCCSKIKKIQNKESIYQLEIRTHSPHRTYFDTHTLTETLKSLPSLTTLKFIIRSSLFSLEEETEFLQWIKYSSKIKQIQIYTERIYTETEEEMLKEYFEERIGFEIFLVKEYGEVTLKDKQQVEEALIQRMQATDPSLYSATQLSLQILSQLPKVEKWSILRLYWSRQYEENMDIDVFQPIQNIYFDKLRDIALFFCVLSTIQPISRLQAPSLQNIQLSYNVITSLKPLIKLHSPSLEKLILKQNILQDQLKIQGGNFPILSLIYLQVEGCQCQSLNFFAKYQLNEQGAQINYGSDVRIEQKTVSEKLRQKFMRRK